MGIALVVGSDLSKTPNPLSMQLTLLPQENGTTDYYYYHLGGG
jgi:hypothetical protein